MDLADKTGREDPEIEAATAELLSEDDDDDEDIDDDDVVVESSSSGWDGFKERMYDVADAVGARLEGGDGRTATRTTTPIPETPGERLMREYESIDATSSSSSVVDDDDNDDDGASELAEARREADEAESMLRIAEEEAARWERELADLEEAAASAEAAELASVAEAYRAALDAANDNVEALTAQVAGLETELSDAITRMERSVEDKERIGAEYAFLAKNYSDLKRRSEGGGAASVELLNEEIAVLKSRIADAESRLEDTERSLAEAKDEAQRWRDMHDEVLSRMTKAAEVRDGEHAAELRAERESYELRVLEATASLEEERMRARAESIANMDVLRAEFEKSVEENSKMISALREALRKTRREGRKIDTTEGEGEGKSSSAAKGSAAGGEVDDVRTRMNEEVANLRSVLKSVQGEMAEKEREVRRAVEERGEAEKLMEEIRVLRLSLEDERAKASQDNAEYEERLSSYTDTENALKQELEEKKGAIASLTQERDASVKQAEALKLELEVLESKVKDVQSLEASNASLVQEMADERSAMESRIANTEQKIASLEDELKVKREEVSSTEKVLKETQAALDTVREQAIKESASVKKLEDELKTMTAKLADAEASQLKSVSQQQEVFMKQIEALQSQSSSLSAQLKEANDKYSKSEQILKDYEARVESMKGTLMQTSSTVLARADELATAKEQAKLAMAEQTMKNERLRSELDRVRKEMSNSLAEANIEVTQRGALLKRKEKMLAELQDKYDSVLDQMDKANASAKKKIALQAEQLRTLEASGSEEKSALLSQISQLRKEILSVKSDSQKTITALNSEMKSMSQEIKQEQRLRDEAMKNKSELEKSLMLAVTNAEKATRDKSIELEQMNLQIEKTTSATAAEAEKSRRLQLDLKETRESLKKADFKINQLDKALQTKESALSELQRKNQQLLGDIKNVQETSQKDVSLKSAEIKALKDMVANLTVDVDKEIKLRQDVIAGKMSVESLLQKKLDDVTKAMENIRADARKTIDGQALELRQLETCASKEKSALVTEISQLKKDMSVFQVNAQKAIDARTNEIKNLNQVIANLKATIAEEKSLKEVVMQGKSELEKALQTKIKQLSEDIANAQKNAMTTVKEKNLEMDRLNAHVKELTQAVNAETALKIQTTKERDEISYQLKAKIAQLEKDLADDRAKNLAALNQRDDLLSFMQADLNSLSKAKDNVQKERDDIEKELTTKIFGLKNKISTIQMNADQTIKSKSDEVDSLKIRILEESKSKDALIKEKSDELARMAKDLRAELELVAQLSKNLGAARADAAEAIKAKKNALDEKAAIEAKMRADLEQSRNDQQISRAINEIAVPKLVSELEVQQSAMDPQNRANQEAALKPNQPSKIRQTKHKDYQETSKPKGFGRPAMKKPPLETPLLSKTIPLSNRITVEDTEQVGKGRVTEPPDVIVDRIDVVANVAQKTQKEKEMTEIIYPKSTSPTETGGRKNSLRQLVTPQARGIDFVRRNTAEGISSQAFRKGGSGGKNPLADLLVVKDEQNQASFPKRKAVPAPSSQASLPRQGSPSTPKRTVSSPSSQGDTRKHGSPPYPKRETPPTPSSQGPSGTQGVPSFPKREEAVSHPSSQASILRQGAPAPPANSPASTILGVSANKSPLTSLVIDTSVTTAFPRRKKVPTPSSQASPKPPAEKKRLSLSDLIRTRPNSFADLAVSAQTKGGNESIATKKMSLKDLIPSMGKPIGSYGNKKTTTKLGGIASPEQKPDSNDNSGFISKSIKKRSLKDLIPAKATLGSYGNKKTTTKLGGMASPEQAASTMKVEKQKAMKEDVLASVVANVGTPKDKASKSESTLPSYSSLSSIIQSQNPRQMSPLHNRYKERKAPTKFGGMVKAAVEGVETPSKQMPMEISTDHSTSIDDDSMNIVDVSMKIQEAFQRALLSARIANDAKAKVLKSSPKYRNAGLSQVVPSQTKPTLSQQKAFANNNRRTSLFPEKLESHLSRLLQK